MNLLLGHEKPTDKEGREQGGHNWKDKLWGFCSLPTGGKPSGVSDLRTNSQNSEWTVIPGTYKMDESLAACVLWDLGQVGRWWRGLQYPICLAWLQRKTERGRTCQLGASYLPWAKERVREVRSKEMLKGSNGLQKLGPQQHDLYFTKPWSRPDHYHRVMMQTIPSGVTKYQKNFKR